MIIDNNKIKLWSSIGSRASFGLTAFELAKNNNNLFFTVAVTVYVYKYFKDVVVTFNLILIVCLDG